MKSNKVVCTIFFNVDQCNTILYDDKLLVFQPTRTIKNSNEDIESICRSNKLIPAPVKAIHNPYVKYMLKKCTKFLNSKHISRIYFNDENNKAIVYNTKYDLLEYKKENFEISGSVACTEDSQQFYSYYWIIIALFSVIFVIITGVLYRRKVN